MSEARSFPEGFRWGVATAAHQIEGGNVNNDWWDWEHRRDSPCVAPSGDACDSWNRWRDDVALLASSGFDNYRFSIEWSRIEPEPGEWSRASVDHYLALGDALLEVGVDPVITFHHFTTPRWVAQRGGWAEPETARRFAGFCERASRELAPVLRAACTINEPNVVAVAGYLAGVFPPGARDVGLRRRVIDVQVDAHRRAVDAIRAGAPGVPVGLTLAMTSYEAVDGGEEKLERIRRRDQDVYLDATDGDDFIGVQTYSRTRVGPQGVVAPEPGVAVVETMGYEYWPESLEEALRRAWEYTGGRTPLVVTENGLASTVDAERIEYVGRALAGVQRAIADGVDVRGYTYWSLLDNFEWAYGYEPRFGLVAVDPVTFAREPKPSFGWLGGVARANALGDDDAATT